MAKQVEIGKVHAEDMSVLASALKLWIRNARAAAGTMRGLGKETAATELTEEAEDIEQRLLPRFDEQGNLLAGAEA